MSDANQDMPVGAPGSRGAFGIIPNLPMAQQDHPGLLVDQGKPPGADPFADIDPNMQAASAQVEPKGPDPFADLNLPPVAASSSALGAFTSHALRGILPTGAGMVGAGAGAEAGTAIGAFGGPVGAAVGGIVGGVAGFLGASSLASGAQDWGLRQMPDNWQETIGQSSRQQRLQEAQHPMASFLGGIAPYAVTMYPGALTTKALDLPENATTFQRLMANPLTSRVFGGTVMGGMELSQEEMSGETPSWAKIAVATGFGLIFNKPTRFGEYLTGLGAGPAYSAMAPLRGAAMGAYMLRSPLDVPPEGLLDPHEPTVAQGADLGVVGPGITESTFQGGEEQNPATRITAHNAAADEQAALGAVPTPDLNHIARRLDPEAFQENDELLAQRGALRSWIADQGNPPDEAFDALAGKRSEVEAALRTANPNSPDAKNLRAQLADIGTQEEELGARREAWSSGTYAETPDVMLARQHLMDTEHALWDLGPRLSAAMRRAADHAGQVEEPIAEPAAALAPEAPVAPAAQPPAPPAEAVPEAPPAPHAAEMDAVVHDRTNELVAAGMSREQADANVRLEAAYYETLSRRFGGALGTPAELFRQNAARVVGRPGRGAPVAEAPAEAAPQAVPEAAPAERPRLRSARQIMDEDKVSPAKAVETQQQERTALADWQASRRSIEAPAPATEAPLLPTTETPAVPAHTEATNGGLEALNPAEIGVDADRFQFKSGANEAGVTERLDGVQKWDPRLAGTALVWRDADGRNWIVDGHQRLGLAQRLAQEGQEGIRLNAFVLDAKDGVTDAEARVIAAVKNISEGTGTPIDAAKIFREAEVKGIELPPLPPRSALVRDGRALARLSPDAFGMAVNDVVPVAQAATVGRLVADPLQQVEAMRVLAKAKPDNLRQAELMVRDVVETAEERTEQGGLFGEEHFAASAVLERAKVADEAMRQLTRDRTTFRTLVGEAERIESHGENVLDLTANQARLTGDERAKQLLTQLATRRGPVSDALTGIARRVRDRDIAVAPAAREFLDIVRRSLEEGLGERPVAGGPVAGAAAERELAQPQTDLLGRPIIEPATRAAPEPTIRTDERQIGIPGTEPSAVQAQAARDQTGRGGIGPSGEVKPADEGLFAPEKPEERELFQGARGKITLRETGNIIHLMNADASTFMHETSHDLLEQLLRHSEHPLAPVQLRDDADIVRGWLGADTNDDITYRGTSRKRLTAATKMHEKFARGFEQYLREGVAPSPGLASVFAQFKDWLVRIYQTIKGLGAPISDDVRGVFDRMLAFEPQRTVHAAEREEHPSLAAVHRTDAEETEPQEANAAADRLAAERTTVQPPPEIEREITAAAPPAEQQPEGPGAAAQPGAEAGAGPEGRGEVAGGGGQPEPVAEGGGVGTGHGGVGAGRGETAPQGTGLRGGPAEQRRPVPGPNAGAEHFAPGPADTIPSEEPKLVDLAGNIRVENLTDVESVAQAIHDSADRNDEFKSVRGGMTKGQMLDLAEAMGLDPEKIDEAQLSRMFGGTQELGAKILAARRLVVRSAGLVADAMKTAADGTDQDVAALGVAIARHDMIQSALAGVTAEWGRAGNAFHSLLHGWQTAEDVNQLLKDNLGRDLFQLKMIAKMGKQLDTPGKVSKFLRDAQERTFGRMVLEYWINGLISGPATHATYMVGNAVLAAEKAGPETAAAAAIGAVRNALGRRGERVQLGEVGAQFRGAFRELPSAVQAALEAYRSGATTLLPGETARPLMPFQGDTDLAIARNMTNAPVTWAEVKGDAYGLIQGMRDGLVASGELIKAGGVEGAPTLGWQYSPLGQIPDLAYKGVNVLPLGTLARLPSRNVAAIHSTFRALNYSMEINALAYRQAADEGLTGTALTARVADLRQNPTEDMMGQAVGKATQLTLMGQGGRFTQNLARLVNTEIGGFAPLKFVDPFVRIAGNIMNQALIQRTPIGLISAEVRADLMGRNGNIAQDTAAAKMLMGTAYAVAFGGLAAGGLVNGSGPADPNKAAMWRLAGNQAHSIRIGDIWYDIHRLGPMGMLMSVAADMYDVAHQIGTEDADVVGKSLVHALSQNILDESFMRGPADLIRAVTESDRYGASYVRNFLSSFMPYSVGMAQMARAADPYSRQARTIMDTIRAKTPGLSESLFPRRDIWGEPMPSGDALIAPGITAIYERRMSTDPVNIAMLNLGLAPAPAERRIRNVPLTDQQYDDYARVAGVTTKMQLDALVRSQAFQEWPNGSKYETIKEVIRRSREAAAGWMMMKYPTIPRDAARMQIERKTGQKGP